MLNEQNQAIVVAAKANQTLRLYLKHNPGTELLLPYMAPLSGAKNALSIWWRSRMKMQAFTPQNMFMKKTAVGMLAIFSLSAAQSIEEYGFVTSLAAIFLMICAISSAISAFNFINFRFLYGENWLHAMLGPTNVGVSRESIKLCWLGKTSQTRSLIVGWNEILTLDAHRWTLETGDLAPKIRVKHSSLASIGVPEAWFELSLEGFGNIDECRAFIAELDRNVAEDRKTILFRRLFSNLDPVISQINFARTKNDQPTIALSSDA